MSVSLSQILLYSVLDFGESQVGGDFFKVTVREVVKKVQIFYGQVDRKEGWSATSALLVSKCENFDPFFSFEYDSMILKTHFMLL